MGPRLTVRESVGLSLLEVETVPPRRRLLAKTALDFALGSALLLAALPTGTGPFMLAEFYGRQALVTSRVVLATTILSVATLSLYLAVSR